MSEPNVNVLPVSRSRMNLRTLSSLGMLTAVAYVVMYLSKMLPQVSGFLQMDLKMCIRDRYGSFAGTRPRTF